MSLGLSLSARRPLRGQLSYRDPALGVETAQLRSVPNGIDHESADVHAASVHAQLNALRVIRDHATEVALLTLTLTVSSDAEAFAPDPRSTAATIPSLALRPRPSVAAIPWPMPCGMIIILT